MNLPRVLHFNPFREFSGPIKSMLVLVEQLAQRGPTWAVAVEEGDVARALRAAGAQVQTVFPGVPARWGWRERLRVIRTLHQAARGWDIQILHCHTPFAMRYIWPASWGLRTRTIAHERETYRPNNFHRFMGRADHWFAVSRHVLSTMPEAWRPRTSVIYDSVKLPPTSDCRAPSGGLLRVGMAGLCEEHKGHDLLLEAAAGLLHRHEFAVHFCGIESTGKRGEWGAVLRQRVEKTPPGIRGRIFLEPFRRDIENFYRSLNIFVVPSRCQEGFARVAIESMSWGLPVIVADHGGLSEAVEHDQTGLKFRPFDSQDLAEQLRRLLVDANLRRRLGEAGRAKVQRLFSAELHADVCVEVYRRILARPR